MIELMFIAVAVAAGLWQVLVYVKSTKRQPLLQRITLVEGEDNSFRSLFLMSFETTSKLKLSGRSQEALYELPEFLDLLVVALASGEGIFNSICRVTKAAKGQLAKEFQKLIRAVQLGESLDDELASLAKRVRNQQVVEFCNKLTMANRRGTPLAHVLQMQSITVRTEIQNQLFKQAGKNETRMMIPLVFLILPVTVLFAVYPSLQLLNISTI